MCGFLSQAQITLSSYLSAFHCIFLLKREGHITLWELKTLNSEIYKQCLGMHKPLSEVTDEKTQNESGCRCNLCSGVSNLD